MKYLLIALVLFLNSCEKSNSVLNYNDDNCFIKNERTSNYIDKVPLTAAQILRLKPKYLEISTLKDYRSFKKDSIEKVDSAPVSKQITAKRDEIDNTSKIVQAKINKVIRSFYNSIKFQQLLHQ